ncbi:hypothetical protein HUJ05_011381 [Dendroctonus ponderosae]|nr:hypothetical protein HUJ05_011381 [Dendroctonus ponderosae]
MKNYPREERLLPATDYQFRVITQYNPQDELWLMYSLPEFLGNDSMDATSELRAPKYLHEDFTTSTSTRLSWDRVSNAKFYTVCYVPTKDERECEQGNFAKSYSPKVEVSKLQPNTEYIFKVRAHDSNSVPGGLSQPLRVRTPADVPSPVVELGFSFLNSTTVCVYWQPPAIQNGPLENYVVSYTTDPNWSLEHLLNFTVAADQRKPQSCRDNNKTGLVSTFLTNLSTDDTYFVMVRAANDVGIGQPCPPIIVRTFHMSKNPNGMLNGSDVAGIILGILMAALCILCCVSFILLRRRCLKRRANTRARLAMSSNYHPVVAHYRSQLGTVQVRLVRSLLAFFNGFLYQLNYCRHRMDEPCSIAHHEVEQLVAEEPYPHIPPATPEQLDTKGARDLPNGCVNGIGKQSHVNGKVLNGDVHITENPQYYAFECNGNLAKNKSEPLLRHYEEDPNSNVNPSKFYDFYKFFDSAKRCKQSPDKNGHLPSKSNGSSAENSLNSTQLSFLDGSMASNRRLSPVLEPNG